MTKSHTIALQESADAGFLQWTRKQMQGRHAHIVRMTPQMARVLMDNFGHGNRPLAEKTVQRYARAMAEGRWLYTGEAIVFSKTRILNGQHRLTAGIKSNTAFDVVLIFGVEDDAFLVMDTGKKRTAGDALGMLGVKEYNVCASISRFVRAAQDSGFAQAARANTLDNDEVVEFYEQHPGISNSVWVSKQASKNQLPLGTLLASMHYCCSQKSRRDADEFFGRVVEGIGFTSKRDPAYVLRNRIMQAHKEHSRLRREHAVYFVAVAWNHFRAGNEIKSLRVGSGSINFPKLK